MAPRNSPARRASYRPMTPTYERAAALASCGEHSPYHAVSRLRGVPETRVASQWRKLDDGAICRIIGISKHLRVLGAILAPRSLAVDAPPPNATLQQSTPPA